MEELKNSVLADEMLEIEYVECVRCGERIRLDTTEETVDGLVCGDCFEEYDECGYCYQMHRREDMIEVGNQVWCEQCVENHATFCQECEQYHITECTSLVTTLHGDEMWCDDCISDSACECAECGGCFVRDLAYYDEDSEDWYCEDCYGECGGNLIRQYHSFNNWYPRHTIEQELELKQSQNKYFQHIGLELEIEVDSDSSLGSVAIDLNNLITDDSIVFSNDGSLNHGFEIITQPFTIEYWKEYNILKDVCKRARKIGCISHDTRSCGLHFHVDRESLSENTQLKEQEVIENIIMILETFKEEFEGFARRKRNSYCSAYLLDNNEPTLEEVRDAVLKDDYDRYRTLNLRNSRTIEFRFFRGTLKYSTIMASLELVDNIVSIAKSNKLDGLTFNDIINYNKEHIEIQEYVKERNFDFDDSRKIDLTVIKVEKDFIDKLIEDGAFITLHKDMSDIQLLRLYSALLRLEKVYGISCHGSDIRERLLDLKETYDTAEREGYKNCSLNLVFNECLPGEYQLRLSLSRPNLLSDLNVMNIGEFITRLENCMDRRALEPDSIDKESLISKLFRGEVVIRIRKGITSIELRNYLAVIYGLYREVSGDDEWYSIFRKLVTELSIDCFSGLDCGVLLGESSRYSNIVKTSTSVYHVWDIFHRYVTVSCAMQQRNEFGDTKVIDIDDLVQQIVEHRFAHRLTRGEVEEYCRVAYDIPELRIIPDTELGVSDIIYANQLVYEMLYFREHEDYSKFNINNFLYVSGNATTISSCRYIGMNELMNICSPWAVQFNEQTAIELERTVGTMLYASSQ